MKETRAWLAAETSGGNIKEIKATRDEEKLANEKLKRGGNAPSRIPHSRYSTASRVFYPSGNRNPCACALSWSREHFICICSLLQTQWDSLSKGVDWLGDLLETGKFIRAFELNFFITSFYYLLILMIYWRESFKINDRIFLEILRQRVFWNCFICVYNTYCCICIQIKTMFVCVSFSSVTKRREFHFQGSTPIRSAGLSRSTDKIQGYIQYVL